jgi:hypothetical protein
MTPQTEYLLRECSNTAVICLCSLVSAMLSFWRVHCLDSVSFSARKLSFSGKLKFGEASCPSVLLTFRCLC